MVYNKGWRDNGRYLEVQGLGIVDRRILALAAILVIAVIMVTMLGGGGEPSQVTLQGEGSTFIYPQIQAWSEAIRGDHPRLVVNYNPTGSGAGQSAFIQGVVDFAGSDPPLSRGAWESLGGNVVQMPVVIGMVAVVYNLPGVEELRLDAQVLALIYKGEIEYWDDPAIAGLNPGVSLPHERIVAVHRSDSSGTTNVFTLFLHKAAPNAWPEELVGKVIDWPVDATGRGVGGKGNQGVMEIVKSTPYSIGYVEYAYAVKTGGSIGVALIKNREGSFVAPTPEAAQEAARNALASIPSSPDADWSSSFDAIVYAPGGESYPITSWSFLLFYKTYDSEDKAEAVRTFIEWINTRGQSMIIEGYVAVPEEIRQVNLKAVDMITGG